MAAEISEKKGKVYVQLKNSLKTLNAKIKKSGSLVKVGRYSQKEKDRDKEGHYEGGWDRAGFPRSEHYLGPNYCPIRNKFSWDGGSNDFTRIVKSLSLRYPENYRIVEKRGERIDVSGEDQTFRLTDYNDPIFNHPEIKRFFLSEGSAVLNLDNPLHEFIYLAKKSELTTSTEEKPRTGATIQFKDVKVRNKKNGKAVAVNLKAAALLHGLSGNDAKLMKIAQVLKVPGVNSKSDPNLVIQVFSDIVINNTETKSKDFGISYQAAFLMLAEMKDSDLQLHYDISRAIKSKILVKKARGYDYIQEGEPSIEVPASTKDELYEYLNDASNSEFFIKFCERLK